MTNFRERGLAVIVTTLLLLLSACSTGGTAEVGADDGETESGQGDGDGNASEAESPEASADKIETLVVDINFGHSTPDPARENSAHGRMTLRPVYETLLHYPTTDLTQPEPLLAESYEVNDDATEYTFRLAEEAVFSDGSPVTAADVIWTFNRFVNIGATFAWLLEGVTFEEVDEKTVVLRTESPNPALPALLTSPVLGILNSDYLIENGGSDAEDAAESDEAETFLRANPSAGSGPYVMTEFSDTTQIVYERNDNYWGEMPAFSAIHVRNADPETQALNVQRGEAHIAMDLTGVHVEGMDQAGLQVVQEAGSIVWFLQLNLNEEVSSVTANPDFREAVAYALDYERLRQLSPPSAGRPCGLVPEHIMGSLPVEDCIERDLDRAREALERSGIEDPSFQLDYTTDFTIDGILFQDLAEAYASQLAEVGIQVDLVGHPLSVSIERWQQGLSPGLVWSVSVTYPDPGRYLSYIPPSPNAVAAGWDDEVPELSRLVGEIQSTPDQQARESAVMELQRLQNEYRAFIPTLASTQTKVADERLTNIWTHALYYGVDLAVVGQK